MRKNKKPWISEDTWSRVEERKEIKQRRNRTNNTQEKQALSREYNRIHREVKRSFRKDRRDWAEELAKEAEQAAEQCDMRKLYNITKTLANKKSFVKKPVKNKEKPKRRNNRAIESMGGIFQGSTQAKSTQYNRTRGPRTRIPMGPAN